MQEIKKEKWLLGYVSNDEWMLSNMYDNLHIFSLMHLKESNKNVNREGGF